MYSKIKILQKMGMIFIQRKMLVL